MVQIYIYFQYLSFLALFLITIYGIGRVICKIFAVKSTSFYISVFQYLIIGLITCSTTYAILQTKGKSVLILFIPITILALYEYTQFAKTKELQVEPKNVKNAQLTHSAILVMLGAFLLIFSFYFFSVVSNDVSFPFQMLNDDYVLYSNSAYYNNLLGQENIFHVLNTLDTDYQGSKPHHYFDTWLSVGLSGITGQQTILHLYLSIFPALVLISFIGFIALCEVYEFPNYRHILLSFALLFTGGLTYEFYKMIGFLANVNNLAFSLVNGLPKLLVFFPFLIGFFLLRHYTTKPLSILALLCMPLCSITAFPAVIGGISIALIAERGFRLRLLTNSEYKRSVGYSLVVMLSVPLFYLVCDSAKINMEGTSAHDFIKTLLNDVTSMSALRTRTNIIVGSLIQLGITYFPLLLIIVFGYRYLKAIVNHEQSFNILLILSILTSGVIAWAALFKLVNGMQLLSNPILPLLNCSFATLIIYLLFGTKKSEKSKSIPKLGISVVVILVSIAHLYKALESTVSARSHIMYDSSYLNRIKDFLQEGSNNQAGASILSEEEYINTFYKYTAYNVLGKYLCLLKDGAMTVSISDYNVKINESDSLTKEREEKAIQLGIFYRYVQEKRKKGTYKSVEESQLEFIKKYHLRYIIISKVAYLPSLLEKEVKEVIVDKISGERFMILK